MCDLMLNNHHTYFYFRSEQNNLYAVFLEITIIIQNIFFFLYQYGLMVTEALGVTLLCPYIQPSIFVKDFSAFVCWINLIFGLKHHQGELCSFLGPSYVF